MRVTHGPKAGATGLIVAAAILAACSALNAGTSQAPPEQILVPSAAAPVAEPTTVPATAQADVSTIATATCSALLDDIPSVQVNAGKATLAAAYDVNGIQLATFLEQTHEANGVGDSPSTWRDEPTQPVTMCIFDGDFITFTPGPPGHDTSASRVLVLIVDGLADLWAVALEDASAIPTTDPATLSR